MKKIYCGLLSINDYLLPIIANRDGMRYIRSSIGGSVCNFLNTDSIYAVSECYVHRLVHRALPQVSYTTGYMVVTSTSTYYSDNISKIILGLTKAKNVRDALHKLHINSNTVYQVCTGKYMIQSVATSIMKATNSLLLICLAEADQCFGPELKLTPEPDWDLCIHDKVLQAIQNKSFEYKEEQPKNDSNNVVQPVLNEVGTIDTQFARVAELFGTLTKEEQKVALNFARRRANVSNLRAGQLALLYCLDKSKDTAIIDLIKALTSKY